MVYSDTTNKLGIIQAIDDYVDTDSSSYPTAQKTRNVNRWYRRLIALILKVDGRWVWDDLNKTTLPIATADLAEGQKDYEFDTAFLDVTSVEIKDSAGNWSKLKYLNPREYTGSIQERFETNGQPEYYTQFGESLYLLPATNYSISGGLAVFHKRSADYFSASDTTKEPGFAEIFHDYLALGPALDYANQYKPDRVPMLLNHIKDMEKALTQYYGTRGKDRQTRIRGRRISSK